MQGPVTKEQIAEIREAIATVGKHVVAAHKQSDKFGWLVPATEGEEALAGTAGRMRIAKALALVAVLRAAPELLEAQASYSELEPCGHAKNFLVRDAPWLSSCTLCAISKLEKEVSPERILKREALDKFAAYCIEGNRNVDLLNEEIDTWKQMFERQGERIERIEQKAQRLIECIGACTCDEAFTSRKLKDPACSHHNNQPEVDELIAVLKLKETK